jgi:hypothetical protein
MLYLICLSIFCASCTVLYVCLKRLFITVSFANVVILVPTVNALGCMYYCMWCQLIVNCLEVCLVKAQLTALLSLTVFVYYLLNTYSAWHNTSFRVTHTLFWVYETSTQPNLSLQDLLHAVPEPPKRLLATVSLLLVRAHDPHLVLPACGCDLVGSMQRYCWNR